MIYHVSDGRIYHAWRVCDCLYGGAWRWGFWMRLCGYGPMIQMDKPVFFSESYGYRKIIRIGRWSLQWLKP